MGTEGKRYEFTLWEREGEELSDVVSAKGGPERIIRSLIDAAELVAQEAGIQINWPGGSGEDASAKDIQEALDDPETRQMMTAMFGPDAVEGFAKMARLGAALEGQPGKAGQS